MLDVRNIVKHNQWNTQMLVYKQPQNYHPELPQQSKVTAWIESLATIHMDQIVNAM